MYGYEYKDNAARSLKSVALPNGLDYKPQTDVNGRNTGKLLSNASGDAFGEYIYYRKEGDHATNMVSTVRYGEKRGQGDGGQGDGGIDHNKKD